jgi:hypothetical protein
MAEVKMQFQSQSNLELSHTEEMGIERKKTEIDYWNKNLWKTARRCLLFLLYSHPKGSFVLYFESFGLTLISRSANSDFY